MWLHELLFPDKKATPTRINGIKTKMAEHNIPKHYVELNSDSTTFKTIV